MEISSVKSSLFDFVRWTSAFLVLAGHIPMVYLYFSDDPGFSRALVFLSGHAHAAVILFFVLSDYLIAYSDFRKSKAGYDVKTYILNRFTRIYSVLIPAILLTLILDISGRSWLNGYSDPSIFPQDNYLVRTLINILSMQGIWGNRVQLGSNPALWSIGYEFTFYLLYGLFVWKREHVLKSKWTISILIFIFLIRGPQVICYFVLWLLGVLSFRLGTVFRITLPATWSIPVLFTAAISGYYIQYVNIFQLDEMYRDFVWALLLAALFFPDYTSGYYLQHFRKLKVFNKMMAESSYSLYAYHLPFLYFVTALVVTFHPYLLPNAASWIYVMFPMTYLFCFILYSFTEARRQYFKHWVKIKFNKIQSLLESSVHRNNTNNHHL